MNKDRLSRETFLIQLEHLLYDIPKEERDEAMDFYRSYFEDAGAENEAAVLEELESPQIVAQSIREELNAAGNMTSLLKNPPQVRAGRQQSSYEYGRQSGNRGQNAGQGTGTKFAGADFQKTADGSSSGQASYRRYDQYEDRRGNQEARMDKRTKLILFIILAVFTSPIWGTAASGVFGVIGILVASVVVLGVCTVGGIIGGVVCAVMGIVRICMLSMGQGLSMLGIGMLLIAASGIGMVLLLLLCGRFLPWAAGWIAGQLRRLWRWGRSMA